MGEKKDLSYISDTIKPKAIKFSIKVNSLESVGETFLAFQKIFEEVTNSGARETQEIIKSLLDDFYRESLYLHAFLNVLCEKLADVYGSRINFEEIAKEATGLAEVAFEDVRKTLIEKQAGVDVVQQINDIFKGKNL